MAKIFIMFSRFSAFYSPLIATAAGGFLAAEGLEAEFSQQTAARQLTDALKDGSVQLGQSAVSRSFALLLKGETPPFAHFATVNQRDGFFLTARQADPAFAWNKLAGRRVIVDHGGQPMAMFKYVARRAGVDPAAVVLVDKGDTEAMEKAFRTGEADFVHLQGPAPQQLEDDKVGHIVGQVGLQFGPVAFSSLAANRTWLASDMAKAFMRAYRKARAFVASAPAEEIAGKEQGYFPGIGRAALTRCIAAYQKLGNWQGPVEIERAQFDLAVEVFREAGLLAGKPAFEGAVAPPPG
ncbi:MAG: ABC transporter substrate-binding protein [Alphaproteobacteria bacterium]|nr:ABC transporter substrate-binding protein [Alphaproteobacteria bacterium]